MQLPGKEIHEGLVCLAVDRRRLKTDLERIPVRPVHPCSGCAGNDPQAKGYTFGARIQPAHTRHPGMAGFLVGLRPALLYIRFVMDQFNLFLFTAAENPFFFLSWILIITFSICVHEYAHAWMALRKGDDTAASQGHLSLNPLVQMGPSSLILLLMVGIAWGAVPVDVRRMRGRSAAAQVALAGPVANLLLAAASSLILVVIHTISAWVDVPTHALRFFDHAAAANALLFLFNMLPVPMFDGWTVASLFVPAMNRVDMRQAGNISWMLILVVWMTPVGDWLWQGGFRIADTMTMGWLSFVQLFV